ncbi:MAG: DNA polymerase III subunit beta [Alphaproteobacteria bacterium]|nr:DNA polymerase III subunit beta [Alphaproteobacteria bacterium]
MKRADLLERLKTLKPWLAGRGVARLRVFGPHARDTAEAADGIDLLVDFSRRISLMELIGLEQELSKRLAAPVQLSTTEGMKSRLLRRIEGEAMEA